MITDGTLLSTKGSVCACGPYQTNLRSIAADLLDNGTNIEAVDSHGNNRLSRRSASLTAAAAATAERSGLDREQQQRRLLRLFFFTCTVQAALAPLAQPDLEV